MENKIMIKIDGKEIVAKEGQTVVEAARDNGIYIPTLCDFKSLRPAGTCRVCTVKVGGRPMTACTTICADGMDVENDTENINEIRKALIEMLFVEGNHMCPTCEKSGNCDLQALAYRYKVMAPRFPYLFPNREVDASVPHLFLEHNRCIQCLRCVRGVKTKDEQEIFGFVKRGKSIKISVDITKLNELSEEMAQKAMDICPVGAILKRGHGFSTPIGKRKYDNSPIGSDIEGGNK